MALPTRRPLPQPHIPLVNPASLKDPFGEGLDPNRMDRRQISQPWREWMESVERSVNGLYGNASSQSYTVTFEFDGGGIAITSGKELWTPPLPASGSIVKATALADTTGSCEVEIWSDVYGNFPPTSADKITASAPITISSGVKSEDATLTGWTKDVAAGAIWKAHVNSNTNIKFLVIGILIAKGVSS